LIPTFILKRQNRFFRFSNEKSPKRRASNESRLNFEKKIEIGRSIKNYDIVKSFEGPTFIFLIDLSLFMGSKIFERFSLSQKIRRCLG